jgi:hypothetical protein
MRKSRAITLTVLSGLMLTACCVTAGGCGTRHAAPAEPDHTWYDAGGNRIEERWKTDEQGNKVLDAEGRPVPDPQVPHDPYGRPWVYENGAWAPLPPPAGSGGSSASSHSSYRPHPGLWIWGGSGYRSTTSSPVYRSGTGVGSSSPSRSSTSSAPSGSSISRGGFGSTGMGASS